MKNPSADTIPLIEVPERIQMMQNGIWNYAGTLVSGIIGMLLVPVLYHHLGAEAYGLWLALGVLGTTIGTFDFGLGFALTRHIAACFRRGDADDSARLVVGAAHAFLAIGILGAALVAVFGLPLAGVMKLSPAVAQSATRVCLCVSVLTLANSLLTYTNAVLGGLGRFDLISNLSIVQAIARAGVIVVVISRGAGVVIIASVYAATAAAIGIIGIFLIGKVRPDYVFRPGRLYLKTLQAHASFSLLSQLAKSANGLLLETAPTLMLGSVVGAGAIAPFYIGQKFPIALGQFGGSAAQVLFASAGRHTSTSKEQKEFLEFGTRWMVVLQLGPALIMAVLARSILSAWMGSVDPLVLAVFWISLIDVFVAGCGEGATNLLWGRGDALANILITLAVAIPSLPIMYFASRHLGAPGTAFGLLVAVVTASLSYIIVAGRKCGDGPIGLFRRVQVGLRWPAVLTIACAFLFKQILAPQHWPTTLFAIATSGVLYFACLARWGGRAEEGDILRAVVDSVWRPLRMIWHFKRSISTKKDLL
jgi:O-antigen/teichoic acid export membrane protein